MRNPTVVWAFVALAAIAILGSRLWRLAGPGGLLLTVLVVIVALSVIRAVTARPGPSPEPRPSPKDVTPREPHIAASGGGAIKSAARPPVIVVDAPSAPVDDLEQRLRSLERLRTNGLLTEEEYEAKRARVIAEF